MHSKFLKIVLQTILNSKHAIRLYVNDILDQALINECIRVVNRGIVLDVYLSESLAQNIEHQFFLLNNLRELRAKGGNIYIINELTELQDAQYICQTDFDTIALLNKDGDQIDFSAGSKEYDVTENWFEDRNNIREYNAEEEDIALDFSAQSNSIIEGTTTSIQWSGSNAQRVVIKGIGEVALQGEMEMSFSKDTILIIEAASKNQIRRKAIKIVTIKQLALNYDVQFLNPASKKFISLKNELNFEGVFGVFKGSKVKFSWNVLEADQVIIKPFGIEEKVGEHVFQIEGTLEIEIHTTLQNKTKTKRIIIHEFPRPVFSEKLIEIKEDFTSTAQLDIKDLRQKAIELINEKGLANQEEFATELREKIKSQEQGLMAVYENMNFDDFYNDHSVTKLNEKVRARLKSYFKNKPGITDIINLLYKYDG